MDTFNGLPAHPLLVHLPIVLVPLITIGLIVAALRSEWMRRLGWVLLGLSGVGLVATFLAAEAGEALEESVEDEGDKAAQRLLRDHTSAGDRFRWIMLAFFVVVAALVLWDWYSRRSAGATADAADATPVAAPPAAVGMALRGLAAVVAVLSSVAVYDVGHSGAKSTWHDVKVQSEGGEGGEGG